jgi:N utilization substance protein B
MRRSEQRRQAAFGVYQHDVTGQPLNEALPPDAHPFTRALAAATVEHAAELDAVIGRHSHGWTIDRIAPLERAIMRVALLEMLHPDAVPADTPIPAEGAIDEAVATAKDFCGADAPAFVNGILDAALRELRQNQAPLR